MIEDLEECILANKAYSSLKQLNLEECGIKSEGCLRLCKALIDATNYLSLDILNLSANRIGKKGVLGLKEYLADPTHYLKTLILHWNNIGPEGGVHIADALRTNKFL
jgi:Ran GTPase-activating protein (RanGAP) involved in mRNA processing and transport